MCAITKGHMAGNAVSPFQSALF